MIGNDKMKFVVLRGREYNNTFYTMNHEHPELLAGGSVGCDILGYADTDEDARKIIYPTKEDETLAIVNYLRDVNNKYLKAFYG